MAHHHRLMQLWVLVLMALLFEAAEVVVMAVALVAAMQLAVAGADKEV